MRISPWRIYLLSALPLLCCDCTFEPFCSSRPDFSDAETAIFIGRVKSVYPSVSLRDYRTLLGRPGSLEDFRSGLLRVWRDFLSPEEEHQLRNATSIQELNLFGAGAGSLSRRIELEVTEAFSESVPRAFEVFTGAGGGDCGVDFETGELYLVVARLNPSTKRWTTSTCSRTRHVRYTDGDITALRTWKKGETPQRSIFGIIQDWTNRSNGQNNRITGMAQLRLHLTAPGEKVMSVTGEHGEFNFTGLSPKVYHLDAEVPGWRFGEIAERERTIDLTYSNCARLFLYMKEQP